jgi:hypothetical protein
MLTLALYRRVVSQAEQALHSVDEEASRARTQGGDPSPDRSWPPGRSAHSELYGSPGFAHAAPSGG